MISEPIPSINQLDDAMQRGVILAKLAKSFCPSAVGKIFEKEGLQYRHTDNINYLFTAMRVVGLPEVGTLMEPSLRGGVRQERRRCACLVRRFTGFGLRLLLAALDRLRLAATARQRWISLARERGPRLM